MKKSRLILMMLVGMFIFSTVSCKNAGDKANDRLTEIVGKLNLDKAEGSDIKSVTYGDRVLTFTYDLNEDKFNALDKESKEKEVIEDFTTNPKLQALVTAIINAKATVVEKYICGEDSVTIVIKPEQLESVKK